MTSLHLAGEVLFGTDSHTCNAGAFGQFASGIGNTDAGFILGTGKLLIKVPPTLRFELEGELPPYIMAKDLILQIIGEITVDGVHPSPCHLSEPASAACAGSLSTKACQWMKLSLQPTHGRPLMHCSTALYAASDVAWNVPWHP